jgi:hypothetical protein
MKLAFEQLDQNGDKKIDKSEFISVFVKMNPLMSRGTAIS